MKRTMKYIFTGILLSLCMSGVAKDLPFNKVIIWGYKLHSDTFSYVNYAFVKAFRYLGYDTYWVDNKDNLKGFDFSNSLFITMGSGQKFPHRDDCRYILHNGEKKDCEDLYAKGNAIALQVYTHDCLTRNVVKLDDLTYVDEGDKCLYQPWATDLLPHEIDAVKAQVAVAKPKIREIYFIGSYMGGSFDNKTQYDAFVRACKEQKINLRHTQTVSFEDNLALIQKSYMAPALQGKWQCDVGYIPCRIFKNISYGQPGVTNSKTVYDLFKGKIVYNSDCYQLFYDAQNYMSAMTLDDLYEQMDLVKEKHTYLNRINQLLNFLHSIKPLKNYTPDQSLAK